MVTPHSWMDFLCKFYGQVNIQVDEKSPNEKSGFNAN